MQKGEMPNRPLFRHGLRGLSRLPHVGEHPGIPVASVLVLVTGIAGIERGGLAGFALGIFFGALVCGPILFAGAVGRSRTSDRISELDCRNSG
jgi:hypothetical protein